MTKHNFWVGIWEFVLRDKDGKIIDQWSKRNALADEGESLILDTFFRANNTPAGFYLRLFNDTPVETDTLALLTGEPVGNGYAAQALARNTTDFPTLALDSGDFQVVSKSVTFLANGGTIGPVTYAVLATSSDNSGKLVAYNDLSMSRTLANGESLAVTLTIKLQ